MQSKLQARKMQQINQPIIAKSQPKNGVFSHTSSNNQIYLKWL